MGRMSLLVLAWMPVVSPAASFGLGAVLRAGGTGDTELALGPKTTALAVVGDLLPFWWDGVAHDFSLGYNAATNTATLTGDWFGIFTSSINWTVAAGSASSNSRIWTIGRGGLTLTAQNNTATNTSVSIQNLALTGPGLAIINPPSLTAAQTGAGTVTTSNSAPITFTTPAGSGSWSLNGQITFTGLAGFVTGGATGDGLRAALNITAVDVPEPEALLLSALGLAALGVLFHFRGRRRRSRVAKKAAPAPQAGTSSKC